MRTSYLCQNFQLVAVRTIPWAKANLNYTAQALIISAGKFELSSTNWIHMNYKALLAFYEFPRLFKRKLEANYLLDSLHT